MIFCEFSDESWERIIKDLHKEKVWKWEASRICDIVRILWEKASGWVKSMKPCSGTSCRVICPSTRRYLKEEFVRACLGTNYMQSYLSIYKQALNKIFCGSCDLFIRKTCWRWDFGIICTCFANLSHVVNSNQKIGRQFAGHGFWWRTSSAIQNTKLKLCFNVQYVKTWLQLFET